MRPIRQLYYVKPAALPPVASTYRYEEDDSFKSCHRLFPCPPNRRLGYPNDSANSTLGYFCTRSRSSPKMNARNQSQPPSSFAGVQQPPDPQQFSNCSNELAINYHCFPQQALSGDCANSRCTSRNLLLIERRLVAYRAPVVTHKAKHQFRAGQKQRMP